MARKPSKSELFIAHNFKELARDGAKAEAELVQSSRELEEAWKKALNIQPETLAAVGNIKAMDAQVRVLARSMGASVGQVKRALRELGEEQPEPPRDFVGALSTGLDDIQEGAETTSASVEELTQKLVGMIAPGAAGEVSEVTGVVEELGAAAGLSSGSIAGLAAAGGVLVVTLGSLVVLLDQVNEKVIKQQVEQERLARLTGLTGTTIGALGTISEFAGVELDRVQDALTDWPEKLDAAREGTGDAAEAIGHLVANSRNAEAAFRDVYQVLLDEEDASQRTALAMRAFGDEAGKTIAKLAATGVELEQAIAFQSEFLQANQAVISGLEESGRKLPALRIAFTSVLSDLLDAVAADLPQDTIFEALDDAILSGAQGIVTVGSFVIDAVQTYSDVIDRNYEILGDSFLGLADSFRTGTASIAAAARGDLDEAYRLAKDTADNLDRVFVVDELGENIGEGIGDLAEAFDEAAAKGERFRAGLEGLIGDLGDDSATGGLTGGSKAAREALQKLAGSIVDLREDLSQRVEVVGLDSIEAEALRNHAAVDDLREALGELAVDPAVEQALLAQLDALDAQVDTLAQLTREEQARTDLAALGAELDGRRLSSAQQAHATYLEQRDTLLEIAETLENTADREDALARLAELDRTYAAERSELSLAASLEVLEIVGREEELIAASYASRQGDLEQALDDQLITWAEYSQAVSALAEQQAQEVALAQLATVETTAGALASVAGDVATTLRNINDVAGDSQGQLAELAKAAALIQIGVSAAQAAASTYAGTTTTLAPILGPAVVPVAAAAAAAAGVGTLSSALPLLQRFARGTSSFRPSAPDAGLAELHKDEGVVSRVGKQSISDEDIRRANRGESPQGGTTVLQLLLRGRVVDEQIYDAQRRPGSPVAEMTTKTGGRRG